MTRIPSQRRPGPPPAQAPGSVAEAAAAGRRRIRVPAAPRFPSGPGCDVVEIAAEYGELILGSLPSSGCVLAEGERWSWIVPPGSDIDVTWPAIASYLPGGAVLVPADEPVPREEADGHSVVHWPEGGAPYTHPILLYFAACCVAGVQPAMTVRWGPNGGGGRASG